MLENSLLKCNTVAPFKDCDGGEGGSGLSDVAPVTDTTDSTVVT